jgi:putative selenate reductase
VLAIAVLDELVGAMPDTFRLGGRRDGVAVSFSAGIDRANFAAAAGLGMAPITVCSDLLQAGGYGRLSTMMKKLSSEMHGAGCPDMQTWVEHLDDRAIQAGHRDAVAEYAARLLSDGGAPYGREANSRPPRTVDHTLEMWGCVSCNLCITVCPNDAMLHLATPASLADRLPDKWQYFCLVELCNECGNCTTFCPERGAPFAVKPRLYLDESRFAAADDQGFLLRPANGGWRAIPKEGWESEREPLETLLNAEEGLPLRPADLGEP